MKTILLNNRIVTDTDDTIARVECIFKNVTPIMLDTNGISFRDYCKLAYVDLDLHIERNFEEALKSSSDERFLGFDDLETEESYYDFLCECRDDAIKLHQEQTLKEALWSATYEPFTHTKTGEELEVLKLTKKLTTDEFKAFSKMMKDEEIGYYSRIAKGFILFYTPPKKPKSTLIRVSDEPKTTKNTKALETIFSIVKEIKKSKKCDKNDLEYFRSFITPFHAKNGHFHFDQCDPIVEIIEKLKIKNFYWSNKWGSYILNVGSYESREALELFKKKIR